MGFTIFLPSNPGYYRFQVSHHLCDPSSHEPQGEELEPEVPDKARRPRGAQGDPLAFLNENPYKVVPQFVS